MTSTPDLEARPAALVPRHRNLRLMLTATLAWHLTGLVAYLLWAIPIIRTASTCDELDCLAPWAVRLLLFAVVLPAIVISLTACAVMLARISRKPPPARADGRRGSISRPGQDILVSTGLTLLILTLVTLTDLALVFTFAGVVQR